MRYIVVCLVALMACGCIEAEQEVTVLRVCEEFNSDAHYYAHRDPHTLLELEDGRRLIVRGVLGEPGDKFRRRVQPGDLR